MRKSKKSNLLSIAAFILVLLLLGSLVAVVVKYSDKITGILDTSETFEDGYTSFAVTNGSKAYSSTVADVIFSFDEELRFDVSYTWGKLATKKDNSFSVKVLPCADFQFTVDGNEFSFIEEKDLSEAFNVKCFADYFTMTIPGSMNSVLEAIYPYADIVHDDLDVTKDYFTLIVTASDVAELIKISFKTAANLLGVELSNTVLEF